jgi:hypothetical protein
MSVINMLDMSLTSFYRMTTSYYDMQCTNASVEPLLPVFVCARMRRAVSFFRQKHGMLFNA